MCWQPPCRDVGSAGFLGYRIPSRTEVFLSEAIDGYPTSEVRAQFLNKSLRDAHNTVKDTAGRGVVPNVPVAAAGIPKGDK